MSWFPNNNHPADKATFDFEITTDSELTVVANGVLEGIKEVGGGQSTTNVADGRPDDHLSRSGVHRRL